MKKILSIILTLVLILSMVGCAAKSESAFDSNIGQSAMNNGSMNSDSMLSPDYEDITPESPALKEDNGAENSVDIDEYLKSQKLIYKCDLEIETLEFQKTTDSIKALIKQHGGFIESDELSDNSHNWYYSDFEKRSGTLLEYLTIRIPTENYEKFLIELDGNGKILSKSEEVVNITKQYNDTQTTIQAYEKEQALLLEMMDKATTISEMIIVEERLSEVNRALAIYKSQMSTMKTNIAFSTITMTVREVVEYTRVVEEKSFIERLTETIVESAEAFLEFLEEALFFTIYIFPYCAILALIVFVFIAIKRKMRKTKQYTVHASINEDKKAIEQNEQNEQNSKKE